MRFWVTTYKKAVRNGNDTKCFHILLKHYNSQNNYCSSVNTKHCFNIMSCIPIARQRIGKYFPEEANAHKNRTSTARQQINKYDSLTVEAVFSAWSDQSGYKEGFSWEESVIVRSWESTVEEVFIWVSCSRELGRVLVMAVEGDSEEIARNALDCAKKSSCVIWSNSETVKNPLPGYD
jgi:hypothetical protein